MARGAERAVSATGADTLIVLAAGRTVGTTDALFTVFLGAVYVECGTADNSSDNQNYYKIRHAATLSALAFFLASSSRFTCSLFLSITTVKIAAAARTIVHPRIGIHTLPKPTPVKSVPKK